jgi:hypothetical protein
LIGGLSSADVINQARDGLNAVEGDMGTIDEWGAGPYTTAGPEYEFVVSEIGAIYGAISALSDQVAVINVATQQLPKDIADNANTAFKWGVPIAVVVGVIVVAFVLTSK